MADIPVSGQTTQFTVRVIQSDAHTCKAQDQTVYVLGLTEMFADIQKTSLKDIWFTDRDFSSADSIIHVCA